MTYSYASAFGESRMVTHLSVRLCWHDSGWNGAICRNPERNTFCTCLDHIREKKDKDFEKKIEMPNRGKHLSEFDCVRTSFPCRGEICVFSEKGYPVKFEHPLKGVVPGYELDPCFVDPIPYSFCPAPYRWMMVDNYEGILKKENLELRELTNEDKFYYTGRRIKPKTWIDDVRLQEQLLNYFWNQLKEKESLVAFYVNSTPAAEDRRRVVVGLGRLEKKYKMPQFGFTKEKPGPNFAWQRQLSHNYPQEGFRLPYQEYLEQGLDTKEIAVTVPEEVEDQFKYVAEHVSDDAMLSLVERIGNSLEVITKDIAKGKVRLTENWARHRLWLQKVIADLWENRGQHPGIGSVLQLLGFNRGMTYHRDILVPLQKQNIDILQHTIEILDGKIGPEELYCDDFANANSRWKAYSSDKDRRQLLTLLMRMEISEDQAERLLNDDLKLKSGIKARIDEIISNPYLIAENDKGLTNEKGRVISEKISLETIDHAMVPAFNFKGKYRADDDRRVRAIMIEELKKSSEEGDTLLSMKELMERVHNRFEGERECRPDLFLIKANRSFYEARLEFFGDNNEFVSLTEMRNHERFVSQKIMELVSVEYREESPDWSRIMHRRFGAVEDKFEETARTEKNRALGVLFTSKFSVLTGRAGTGKTEVVSLLIEGAIEKENAGPNDFLVLAPTGKARVRLKRNFGKLKNLSQIEPRTIHQHLNEYGWLDANFELRESGGTKTRAKTIIVDECSMMPIDLLATLMKSLELGNTKRFILVGDPNQLPPIGPGRPLDDIVNWLRENDQRKKHISNLAVRMRHGRKEGNGRDSESVCLQLADGFLRDFKSKDIEEVYTLINQNLLDKSHDLFFAEWKDYAELQQKLDQVLEEIGVIDYDSYVKSVGLDDGDLSKCESWQVLSPLKHREVSGTISLNNCLQNRFLANTLSKWRARTYNPEWGRRYPSPFGTTKDVVDEDKVIQTRNTRQIRCLPPKTDRYVANGEIGIAGFSHTKNALEVVFSDQPKYQYTYYNGEGEQSVESNLDLAYAITIHKSQGSDFGKVIVIIPERAFNISMEMMYTALTRFKGEHGKTYLLVQSGIETLEHYRRASSSETDRRNTYLFKITVRDDVENIPYAENRIHRTKNGFLVRSKSEVIVANELINAGITLTEKDYESKLYSKSNAYDYKLPDFTFEYGGKKFYWEHLGMLGMESYRKSWERKSQWYKENDYTEHIITSQDGLDGSIDSKTIDRIIEEKLGIGRKRKRLARKPAVRVHTNKARQNKNPRFRRAEKNKTPKSKQKGVKRR
jgi:hypothetical protein